MGQPRYSGGFKVTTQETVLELPLRWKKPRWIFVNSMSDLFHAEVPIKYILQVFGIMQQAKWHQFQILTKRSSRLFEIAPLLPWAPNIWMGVSVENVHCEYRIDHLRETKARVKFVSFEPLLGPVPDINLANIDWVIVGGESGPNARPMKEAWVIDICEQCQKRGVAFFFKQWGGLNRKRNGRTLQGKEWNEVPVLTQTSEVSLSL